MIGSLCEYFVFFVVKNTYEPAPYKLKSWKYKIIHP